MTAPVIASGPPARVLADADFHRLREYVYRRTGIHFADTKRYFVDKRVLAMMDAAGETAFDAYFSALRLGDESLVQQLVNSLTVNETYFLREDHQFDSLVSTVLPRILAEREADGTAGGPVRILSLPSSTGEEPYSIAIRLLEDWPDLDRVDVSITAGDIDTQVLAAARRGTYGARSVHRVPPAVLRRWFEPAGEGRHRVVPTLRDAVDFHTVNVCDPGSMRAFRDYDVVFCRNLLIYFDAVSCRLAAENLFDALRPGGFLFLGHSDAMSRISPIFTPVRVPGGISYQRPRSGGRA